MKFKDIIALLLTILGFGVGLVCAFIMAINRFKNPDMTDMRLMIDYFNVVGTGLIDCIVGMIGVKMMGEE